MKEDTTRAAPSPGGAEPLNILPLTGQRHQCAFCGAEPQALCHHCGRALCAECMVRLPPLASRLWAHGEMGWRQGRGLQPTRVWGPVLEAVHCQECVHFSPRLVPWLIVTAMMLLPCVILMALNGASIGQTLAVILGLCALLGAWLSLRTWRARAQQLLFFPLDAELPTIRLEEYFDADVRLDGTGRYEETPTSDGPRGKLRVKVSLDPTMTNEVNVFQSAHRLSEEEIAAVPARAGTLIVESVMGVGTTEPPWAEQATRRWDVAKPINQWPLLWKEKGDESETWGAEYSAGWFYFDRPGETPPFPVQLQFRLPAHGERKQLEIRFCSRTINPKQIPFFRKARLHRNDDLPPFTISSSAGRATKEPGSDALIVEDLEFVEGVARLDLYFDDRLDPDQEYWLSGEVVIGFVRAFSSLTIVAFYDAFGHRQRPKITSLSYATLRFDINLRALPYAHTVDKKCPTIRLPGSTTRRDDAIIRLLSEKSQLLRVSENHIDSAPSVTGDPPLPPRRRVMGTYIADQTALTAPLLYHLTITPQPSETLIQYWIEADMAALDSDDSPHPLCKKIEAWVRAAGEEPAPPTPPGILARKLEKRKRS